MKEMYVLYLNFGFICNDFVIIGFEVEWINLLHTFVFEASPNKSIELTLQNIDECFSRRGSEERHQDEVLSAEEDPKLQKTKSEIVKKKSKLNPSLNIHNIC